MRKWFASDCSECGRPDGWWEDVAEGPITLQQYEDNLAMSNLNSIVAAMWKPQITDQFNSTPITYGYGKINISRQVMEMAFCEPCANQQHNLCPNPASCYCAHKVKETDEEQPRKDATASE